MTIKDLAARTGYSVGTVSRVLNGQPHVSEKARQAILRAAEDSGFQLNVNAKELKQHRGTTVLAICRGRGNILYNHLVEGIQARMEQTRYPLLVDYIDETDNEVRRAIQLCRERKPLGMLFLGGNWDHFMEDFGQIHVPCVLVTASAAALPFPNLSSVTSDDVLAARLAINHLAELGHRRIAVIGGDPHSASPAQRRYAGCLEAFREHGIPFDEGRDYRVARYSLEGGYWACRDLLEKDGDFTALFAMSDMMAIGAIRALRDAGRRVPEEVSVVGLDGLATGDYTVPRLTTLRQSMEELAEQSVDLLLAAIEAPTLAVHRVIPVTLEKKESTGPVPEG